MPFVHVESPAKRDNLAPAQRPDNDSALVSGDGCVGKTGNVAERDAHGITNGFRQPAQSRAEDDPDFGMLGLGTLANRDGSLYCRVCRVLTLHSSGPISCSILSDTSSISMSRSSPGRNALSKPLSAMPASSSMVRSSCSAA